MNAVLWGVAIATTILHLMLSYDVYSGKTFKAYEDLLLRQQKQINTMAEVVLHHQRFIEELQDNENN